MASTSRPVINANEFVPARRLPNPNGAAAARLVSFVGAGILMVIGITALAGWVTDSRALTALAPGYIPIAPNTAILFLAIGAALLLPLLGRPGGLAAARAIIAGALLVAGARLLEYLTGADFAVDRWMFAVPSETLGLAPVGKMAFFTALGFVLASAGLLAQSASPERRLLHDASRAMALLVAIIGLVFLIGYLYGSPLLYGGRAIPMALGTAAGHFVLGLSMIVPDLLRQQALRREEEELLRASRDQLQTLVAERTVELEMANEELQASVVELEEQTQHAEEAREQALEAERRYRSLVSGLPVGVLFISRTDGIQATNPAAERILGAPLDELRGRIAQPGWSYLREDGSEMPESEYPATIAFATGEPQKSRIMGVRRADGGLVWIDVSVEPLFEHDDPRVHAIVVSFIDITERKAAEEELRKSEEQLRQAQKMEAIGQLAGGVAHDFNNMLTAIKGYGQLVIDDLPEDHPHRADIAEIMLAADRAALLTGQLLAFSRKQILQLRPTDLGVVIEEMDGMLRRLLVADAELVTTIDPELGLARADRGQIEQVLLNLVVNARDAMPNGGRISIEVANVELDEAYCHDHPTAQPGAHVMLAVTDSGTGMDEATRRRIFEPFFTTKGQGQGTGLGLSTVYGIVKQSGGHIWVYSEPGHGTVFRIYFPRVDESAESVESAPAPPVRPAIASAVVLVVDDEESVRRPVRKALERHGYVVHEASSGTDALRFCEEFTGTLDLVVTDMMMPGMHGRELIDRIAVSQPGARVLFTSGYADDQIIRRGLLDPQMAFIQKPFTLPAFLSRVQEVLGSAGASH